MISARSLTRKLTTLSRHAAEPSTALFQGIRLRLTAWYTAILAATLLVLGIALYSEVRMNLLNPVESGLRNAAQGRAAAWLIFSGDPCHDHPGSDATLTACFDRDGALIDINGLASQVPAFAEHTVAVTALRSGTATDTVNIPRLGAVERYALRVIDPQFGRIVGVVVVGALVSDRINALSTLLEFLLLFGLVGLICAAGGGMFLANRSLQPARLAYIRQRDFISDASHELRTPLTLVRTDADVLLRDRATLHPEQVMILEDIVMETSHMTALANSMLDLARLDAGREHIENDVVDLSELASVIARRSSRFAAERDVVLEVVAAAPVLVLADRTLIEHIALILVDNAIKYNRPGGKVTLFSHAIAERAEVVVSDTGIGIAQENLARMGERFFRIDKARSRASGGAGLGVAIAQSIATRLGGTVRIESELGVGTTATLTLKSAGPARTHRDAAVAPGSL